MSTAGVVRELAAAGGSLRLVGGEVKATIPPGAADLLPQLREHKAEIIEMLSRSQPRPETLAQVELLPDEVRQWDDALLSWTQAHCAFRERSWGSLSGLYISHIEHAHQTGGMFAPDVETFAAILMALGFVIEDAMVYGLILKEDWEAAHWQPEAPKVMPRRKRGAR